MSSGQCRNGRENKHDCNHGISAKDFEQCSEFGRIRSGRKVLEGKERDGHQWKSRHGDHRSESKISESGAREENDHGGVINVERRNSP
jgi:hypothetical protein